MRPIDAIQTRESITDLAGKAVTKSEYSAIWKCAKIIDNATTIDFSQVVHGHWNYTSEPNEDNMGGNHDVIQCSVCKENYDFEYDYCPSCGTKMDGGEKT